MSRFLLIGKSFFRLRNYLAEYDHQFITLLDDKTNILHHSDSDVVGDFGSLASLISTAKEVHELNPIDGVIATYENYILPAAHIAKALGLPGLPIEAAEACTDKQLMRQRFARAKQKISPDFSVVKSREEVLSFASSHSFPLILKPANLAKSLLVTKSNNLDELLDQYQHTTTQIDEVYKKYAPNRSPKLIIEEFIEGSIHSVDAFIDDKGKVYVLNEVVDYETGQELGYNDNFHYSRTLPSKLNNDQIQVVRQTAEIGCQSLGMRSSPAHVEIILSIEGPRIVEIGARNGGYRERMHELANGIDITANVLLISMGKQPNIMASRNDPCVTLELFPKRDGIFKGIDSETVLEGLSSLAYYSKKAKPGSLVGKSADGYKACAIVILHNKDKPVFNNDYSFVRNRVHVVTTGST